MTKYLNWRISKVVPHILLQNKPLTNTQYDSAAVHPGHVNTLQIYASSQEATVAASDYEFPTYGATSTHIECTNGKPGGVNYGDDY